jgi:hypothetical protein
VASNATVVFPGSDVTSTATVIGNRNKTKKRDRIMPYEEKQNLAQGIPVYTQNWIRLLKDQQGTFCVQNLRTGSTEIVLSEEGHSPTTAASIGLLR